MFKNSNGEIRVNFDHTKLKATAMTALGGGMQEKFSAPVKNFSEETQEKYDAVYCNFSATIGTWDYKTKAEVLKVSFEVLQATSATIEIDYYNLSTDKSENGDNYDKYIDRSVVNPDFKDKFSIDGTISGGGDAVIETEPVTQPVTETVTETATETTTDKPDDKTYYLFGWINGADYACEKDAENMGDYKFVNGQLKATFTENSYVGVKEEANANWYMTDGWAGEVNSAKLFNTSTLGTTANKLYVPGNVEVTFTLVNNGDGTLTLSYTTGEGPTETVTETATETATCYQRG